MVEKKEKKQLTQNQVENKIAGDLGCSDSTIRQTTIGINWENQDNWNVTKRKK